MSFESIRGQEHGVEVLKRALGRNRLHHAYLFAGPLGVGKERTARAFASALLCVQPTPDKLACNVCHACRRLAEGQHPDFHLVERLDKKDGGTERFIKIEQIRTLQRSLSFKAYEGQRRVVLILEPEYMTDSTSNALLKTLEEPGEQTHFILVSAGVHRLLPTIISRCQRVRFGPLKEEHIIHLLDESGIHDVDLMKTVARLSEGSIGRALMMLEEDVVPLRGLILAALDADEHPPLSETLDLAEDLAKPAQRKRLKQAFHILRTWYRDLLVVKMGGDGRQILNIDQHARLSSRADRLTTGVIQERLKRTGEAEVAIWERMANTRLVLESLFVFLAGRVPTELSQ